MTNKTEIRTTFKKALRIRNEAVEMIHGMAKLHIPEFHFLDHHVSGIHGYAWDCEKSPIGICVYDISKNGFNFGCRCHYCGGPVERK